MKYAITLALFLAGCPLPPPPTPVSMTSCQNAYEHMQMLGCSPTVDGGTWLDVCTNARQHSIDLHTGCRTKATTCEAVKACGQ